MCQLVIFILPNFQVVLVDCHDTVLVILLRFAIFCILFTIMIVGKHKKIENCEIFKIPTRLDFFLRGTHRIIYKMKLENLQNLQQRITYVYHSITFLFRKKRWIFVGVLLHAFQQYFILTCHKMKFFHFFFVCRVKRSLNWATLLRRQFRKLLTLLNCFTLYSAERLFSSSNTTFNLQSYK